MQSVIHRPYFQLDAELPAFDLTNMLQNKKLITLTSSFRQKLSVELALAITLRLRVRLVSSLSRSSSSGERSTQYSTDANCASINSRKLTGNS